MKNIIDKEDNKDSYFNYLRHLWANRKHKQSKHDCVCANWRIRRILHIPKYLVRLIRWEWCHTLSRSCSSIISWNCNLTTVLRWACTVITYPCGDSHGRCVSLTCIYVHRTVDVSVTSNIGKSYSHDSYITEKREKEDREDLCEKRRASHYVVRNAYRRHGNLIVRAHWFV